MSVAQWSKNASLNGAIDPTINLQEGMAPSAVNDSGRAVMARLAEYRDDISGSVLTAGSASAYTATSNQGLSSVPVTGQLLAITVHATNGDGATLTTDGGTTYPIMVASGSPVSAGVMVAGSPYTLLFTGTSWILRDFFGSPFSVPVGGLMTFIGATSPNSSFIFPYGQAISRTAYATLFGMVGTTFGTGNGVNTFNVPDLRGRVTVCPDNLGGVAAGRVTNITISPDGNTIGATGGEQAHVLTPGEMPSHDHGGSTGGMTAGNPHAHGTNAVAVGPVGVGVARNMPGWGDLVGSTIFNNDINHGHSIPAAGGNLAHTNMMPSIILPRLLRVI